MWDAARLERVVANLISNAVKYSLTNGVIEVNLTREPGAQGPCAVLTVQDQGVGIPQADLPHVFERYHRARNVVGCIAGVGLGLASVRQIVESHGGTVTAQSHEGAGTTLTVRLPLGEVEGVRRNGSGTIQADELIKEAPMSQDTQGNNRFDGGIVDGEWKPRPREVVIGGIEWLARMADKARAAAGGTIGDYIYPCPVDKRLLEALALDPQTFQQVVVPAKSDDDVVTAMQANSPTVGGNTFSFSVKDKGQSSAPPGQTPDPQNPAPAS